MTAEVEHVKEALSGRSKVARDAEFGILHDADSDHGQQHPTVEPHVLDLEECFACRRCFGFPGTEEQLDALLGEESTASQPSGQQSLAEWSA